MSVVTRPFAMTKADYFKILLGAYVKKRRWMLLLIIVVAIVLAIVTEDFHTAGILFLLAALLPVIAGLMILIFINTRKNNYLFQEKKLRISHENIEANFEDDRTDTLGWSQISHVISSSEYYLIYLRRGEFLYVPFRAFRNEHDKAEVDQILQEKDLA